MSTILKALRESESGKEPEGPLPGSVDEARRRRRTILAVGVGVVVAAITGTAVFFSHEAPIRAARPPAVPARAPRAAVPARAPAAPAPTPAPVASVAPATGLRPAAPVPAPPPVARVEPPRARVENDAPAFDPPMPEAEAAPFAGVHESRPPPQRSVSTAVGKGPIEVASVRYSPVGSRSTVTLSVDGAAPITLRQGETVNGLEIQLILPEMVYLRQDGNVVGIDVPR